MTAKRRIGSILLIAALSLSFVFSSARYVSAADAYTISLTDSEKNSLVEVAAGGKVTLTLSIANNPGIISVAANISYPSQLKLEQQPTDVSGLSGVATVYRTYSKSTTANPYLLWWNMPLGDKSNKLVTKSGDLAKITFSVKADTAPGDYRITVSAPSDKNLKAATQASGKIVPGSVLSVSNITLSSCTIRVKGSGCNHSWGSWKVTTAAGCEKIGKETRTCSICNVAQERDVPATGHKMGPWTEVKAASCTLAGEQKQKCQNTGCTKEQTKQIPLLGHDFQKGVILKEPTLTSAGILQSKCSRCQQTKDEEIPYEWQDETIETTQSVVQEETQDTEQTTVQTENNDEIRPDDQSDNTVYKWVLFGGLAVAIFCVLFFVFKKFR